MVSDADERDSMAMGEEASRGSGASERTGERGAFHGDRNDMVRLASRGAECLGTGETGSGVEPSEEPSGGSGAGGAMPPSVELYKRSRVRVRRFRVQRAEE